MPGKICVGAIFKKWDDDASHIKYHIIVGDVSGDLACIYINTEARYNNLSSQLQGTQLPITPTDFPFLSHDSFADCSCIKEITKGMVNEHLQEAAGHHCGHVPEAILVEVMRLLRNSKTIEKGKKDKYRFGQI